MRFPIYSAVNRPTAFLARLSELKKRLDPEFVLFRRKVHQFKFPVQTLRSLFREPPQYGAGERGIERMSPDQPRYVRITDIDEFGVLTDEIGVTAETIEPRYVLEEDDLLLARSGNTVGKSYLHKHHYAPYACFYAGYLIRFRFDHSKVLPDYVFALTQLPYYRDWVNAIQRAAGQPNINAQEYSHLDIPTPPLIVQGRIVTLIGEAYAEKRRLDAEARGLLATIDDLLLSELGIPQTPEPPNTIESRMFRRAFSRVTGKRIDPAANWKTINLKSQKYPLQWLRDLAFINPQTRFPQIELKMPISFVPMEAVSDRFGEIVDRQTRAIGESVTYTRFQDGDVIMAKITPCMENGKAAFVTDLEQGYGFGSTEFHVFRPRNNDLSAKFLFHLLRLRMIRQHARLNFTGTSGHQRVDEQFFYRLEIPIPPRPDQDRITDQAEGIKEQARALMNAAVIDLERAKRDIEALILGNDEAS